MLHIDARPIRRVYFAAARNVLTVRASLVLMMRSLIAATATAVATLFDLAGTQSLLAGSSSSLLEGAAAYGDWRSDAPGIRRRIKASDLPVPYATNPTANAPAVIGKPPNARLNVPLGFQAKLLASNLDQPRLIRVAPNGDIFIAERGPDAFGCWAL